MAVPTDVRVEAISQNDTLLNWVSGGGGNTEIYRSTNGSTYASVGGVGSGVVTFTDDFLTAGTKYWYKLTEDAGATFSAVVTVWTHICITAAAEGGALVLPRAGESVSQDDFNFAMERLESMNETNIGRSPCNLCISDGRITLDCSSGCSEFYIEVTEDINSISIIHCCEGADGQTCPQIAKPKFFVPPNVTRKICGWPQGAGFGGDECFRMPISGGSKGRIMGPLAWVGGGGGGSSMPGPGGASTGGGAGGGGGGCSCTPGRNNTLAIKCCTDGCSLSCASTKKLTLLACGGKLPYVWSNTGTISLDINVATTSAVVTPPTNSGSAVAGTAYVQTWYKCVACAAGVCTNVDGNNSKASGCNDQDMGSGCQQSVAGCSPSVPAASAMTHCHPGLCTCLPGVTVGCTSVMAQCDSRTAQMITDGCNPCGLQAGSTVTVTDANGVSVTKILAA